MEVSSKTGSEVPRAILYLAWNVVKERRGLKFDNLSRVLFTLTLRSSLFALRPPPFTVHPSSFTLQCSRSNFLKEETTCDESMVRGALVHYSHKFGLYEIHLFLNYTNLIEASEKDWSACDSAFSFLPLQIRGHIIEAYLASLDLKMK